MTGRRAKVEVEPTEGSPAKTPSSSSSSSGGSTGRAARRKTPVSRLQPQPEEEEKKVEDVGEAWTPSDMRAMRRDLLNIIHRYYLDAISRLPPVELRTTLARGLLVGGHCLGPLHPVHNIIVNSVWYAATFPLLGPTTTTGDWTDDVLLSIDGLASICHRSLEGLVAFLRRCCPSLSTGDALCQLMFADADLATAIGLANRISKSSALRVMASENPAAFILAAKAARHPSPTTFAQFVSSISPHVNVDHNVVTFLLMKHVLSTEDINHLSNVLVPEPPPYEPPQSPLMLSPQVLERVSSQKARFKDTGKRVFSVVNKALEQTGEQLILHSVCGMSLLNQEGLNNCYYHINFLAYRRSSGSAVGSPVLFFTEAIVLSSNDIDIRLCVPVDAATDIGCCFACETNKKRIVHPTYDEHLGSQDFQGDEVDCDSSLPYPLDVDYIYFDADRDRAFANYLNDSVVCNNIGPDV